MRRGLATRLRARSLAAAIALPAGAAVVGALLTGNGLSTWYSGLEKPNYLVPLEVFYLVGAVYYLGIGWVLYRILTRVDTEAQPPLLGLAMAILVMNEAWNVAFFGLRSTLAGFLGVVVFFLPLGLLTVRLWRRDRAAAMAAAIYAVWVLYDVVWTAALWRLNR